MNIDRLAESISRSAYGFSLAAVWQHLAMALASQVAYEERVSIFFSMLAVMLRSGRLKFAARGELCTADIASQLDALRAAWPASPEEDQLDGFGLWFLIDCPVGVVWVGEDGDLTWT